MDKQILSEEDLYRLYDESLDETWGDIEIAGLQYSCSSVLHKVDGVAYRCGFNDWLDSMSDTISEAWIDGKTAYIFSPDGEEEDED